MKGRRSLCLAMVFVAQIILAGCAEVVQVGTSVGAGTGKISYEDKQRIDRLAVKTEKAARPTTETRGILFGSRSGSDHPQPVPPVYE